MFCNVWLFVTLWTVDRQASQSMPFPRQGYWSSLLFLPQSGLLFLPPGDLSDQGLNLRLLHLLHRQMDSLLLCHLGSFSDNQSTVSLLCFFILSIKTSPLAPIRWYAPNYFLFGTGGFWLMFVEINSWKFWFASADLLKMVTETGSVLLGNHTLSFYSRLTVLLYIQHVWHE